MQLNTITRPVFGVCTYIADKMGIARERVRLYFIYLSFLTMGSPIVIYLFVAFWLNVKRYIRRSHHFLPGH